MVRTQVQLTEEQSRRLKRLAAERNVSVAEVVRDAVDRELEKESRAAQWERALAVCGKYRSGLHDIAENHDEYLADAYEH